MDDPIEHRLRRSARRLLTFVSCEEVPHAIVDQELKIMVRLIAGLVGPDRVRSWADEATDMILNPPRR